MSAKYYTHFIAQSDGAIEYSEYRGVVELLGAKGTVQGSRDRGGDLRPLLVPQRVQLIAQAFCAFRCDVFGAGRGGCSVS